MKETDNPVSEIKKEIEQVKQSVQVNPLNDIKKDLTEATNDIVNLDKKTSISQLDDITKEPVSR